MEEDTLRKYPNQRRYFLENKEKIYERHKNHKLKWKYGITMADKISLASSQNGVCAICKWERPLQVDHNHKTGEVRGLLCSDCNKGLGFFKDSPCYLQQAIEYLK